jgi:3-hydroxyisobutyrate dehydrogenase-like beta-hydroxyacid dehydrogenase
VKIGFIGLGTMGFPMAANLIKAGFSLTVWNRSPGPAVSLAELGATSVSAPAEAVDGADVVITMLSDDAATQAVLIDGGVLQALPAGRVHVNMATVSAAFGREMARLHAERQVSYVAAPVLGRVNVAQAGQLNILAAGEPGALEKVQPLFDAMGQKTWRFGDKAEQANVAKLAANFMIASAIETMGEAAALVKGHGVSSMDFLEMITSTIFASPAYKAYGNLVANEQFEPAGFKLNLGLKDIRLALNAGEEANVPLPIAGILRDNFLDNLAHGEGHLDWAALARVSARRSAQS